MRILLTLFLFFSINLSAKNCEYDKACTIPIEGMICADGSPSFISITKRKNAENLLVYMLGGGACWDEETCKSLKTWPKTNIKIPVNWNIGQGIMNAKDTKNPFRKNYNIVTVPYCTGDLFMGDKVAKYSSNYTFQHHGYQNALLAFEKAKSLFPNPKKAALVGCSAGGLGTLAHTYTLNKMFPNSKKYVIDDAGLPFLPPYIDQIKLTSIMYAWNTDKIISANFPTGVLTDFGQLIRHNIETMPDTKFGLVESYHDVVMKFFSNVIGAEDPGTAVENILNDVSEKHIANAEQAKVFYIDNKKHCHTGSPLSSSIAEGEELGDWLTNMIEDNPSWQNRMD